MAKNENSQESSYEKAAFNKETKLFTLSLGIEKSLVKIYNMYGA